MTRLLVPRTHIPKTFVVCMRCESPSRTIRSEPYTDGYHRRHTCRSCGLGFHSLTPYNGGDVKVQALPFKDREMSEFDTHSRMQMWDKQNEIKTVELSFPDEVIVALRAIAKTPRQAAIVAAVGYIEKHINSKFPKDET